MAASTSPSGPMWAAGMGSRRGSDGGLEGGDGGVDEGVLVGEGRAGDQGRPCGRLRPLWPSCDTMVTGMSALPSTLGRDEVSPPG
jgi:hypothetical protein